jgi:methyltransferase (TIGR00027 family)
MMSTVRNGRPSSTAEGVAFARACLTRVGVLDDPYAQRFLGRGSQWLERRSGTWIGRRIARHLLTYIAARTRFYDSVVAEGLDKGAKQVVLIAAGYDARATRLARPGVRFFEIDHPTTQAEKRARMPHDDGDEPIYVPADLATTPLDGALYPAGFNPAQPTVFCCEGLTMYLPQDAIRELLASAARLAAPGSRLGIDFALRPLPEERSQLVVRFFREMARLRGEPVRFKARPEVAEELMERTGWAVDEVLMTPDLRSRFLANGELDSPKDWNGSFVVAATIRH